MHNDFAQDSQWQELQAFLPHGWLESPEALKAIKGLRKDKCPRTLLRIILLHVVGGLSLRETVAKAKRAGLAELTDVGLMYRLNRAGGWLEALCVALLKERQQRQLAPVAQGTFRLIDSTIVKEPGKTGSQWRIGYSISVPEMTCDSFKITPAHGKGNGESLKHFAFSPGDRVIADRGFSHAKGLQEVADHGATFCVRLNSNSMVLTHPDGAPFDLLDAVSPLKKIGEFGSFPVLVQQHGAPHLAAYVCAIRKSTEAIDKARKRLHRLVTKKGHKLQERTLLLADYVIVISTFSEAAEAPEKVLEWYRMRWQIELVFKRLKQKLRLGHIPKHRDESVRAWLYGKLLAALLIEKIRDYAAAISPWGYELHAKR